MEELKQIREYLLNYDGPEVALMEVCGSHTAAISHLGIPGMLSPKISLLSGPGCPVCVTPSAYIDRLIELAKEPGRCITTFGDLMRVPGSTQCLSEAMGEGANVKMVYSPMDTLKLAKENPDINYVFAAVGFETTIPVYALLVDIIIKEKIPNIQLLTALKTMPAAIDWLCQSGVQVTGFIAPGHVSVITGSKVFEPLAQKYQLPFCVAGFKGEELLPAIYALVKLRGQGRVINYYRSVVKEEGNQEAQKLVNQYFRPAPAVWRGIGTIEDSGMLLRPEYASLDLGSEGLTADYKRNKACRCDQVLIAKIKPTQCPLFRKVCTPLNPQGACMVSEEGSCCQYYKNHRE